MKKSAKSISLFLVPALAVSISFLSCGGGGMGMGVGSSVQIQPNQVVVQQMQVAQNTMPWEAGMVNIPNRGANSVIDAGQEDSIRAEGDGNVSINVANITLKNCDNSFRAKDN